MTATDSNQFIGLSWRPGAVSEPIQRALATVDKIAGDWSRIDRPGRLLCSRRSAQHGPNEAPAFCMTLPKAVSRSGHIQLPEELLARLHRDGAHYAFAMSPPFAATWLDPIDGALKAATDAYGIGQIFYFEGECISGVSNSAVLLARVFERTLNAQALTGFALFGAFHEADTPFDQVFKILAGQAISFVNSRRVVSHMVRDGLAPAHTSVQSLAESLRETVVRLSDAAPEADLQLSGGLDSRLILAALPSSRRKRHKALTIGPPESPDVRIASAIVERFGLRHQLINPTNLNNLDADQFYQLLRRAARGFDCSANPVDKAPLLMVERQVSGTSWFNGQNGEILRGFYYPGQPLEAPVSASLAKRLFSWRLAVNDKVNPQLFAADTYLTRRRIAEERIVAQLLSFDGPWSKALDRFYLLERMQRWAGNGIDNLINRQNYLCPFFDQEFVEAAIELPPSLKLNSRAAYRILAALDPELAELPLDSGVRPLSIVEAPLRARASEVVQFAKKAAGRVRRKLAVGGSRATLGSDTVARLWARHKLYERLPHGPLSATGLFDPNALRQIVSGQWLPDRPTLGFVLMIAELCEMLTQP